LRYSEFPPHPELAGLVRCIWLLEGPRTMEPERVLPDGCPELVLHYGDPFVRLDELGRAHPQRRSVFAGQLQRPLDLAPTGPAGMIGVRFEPAGAAPFVGVPLHAAGGGVHALESLWPAVDVARLEDRLAACAADEVRVALVNEVLRERLRAAGASVGVSPVVLRAVARITASEGRMRVDDAVSGLFGSRRQAERAFRAAVGLTPKRLARIVRFQAVFRRLEESPRVTWASLALDCGYYDQAHLIRDFRAFSGVTPARYVATEHPLADCFTAGSGGAGSNS
jgi:AraC-like DNA-binding protein